MEQTNWYEISVRDVYEKINSTTRGLGPIQVQHRRELHGENVLPAPPRRTTLVIMFRQFTSPLMSILIIASIISFVLGDYIDGQVILAAVILNVVVGFIQEFRAGKTMEALRRIVTFKALVIREGVRRLISSSEIVPGDVLVLRAGDRVVADARIAQAVELKANESSLTGEAYPVHKQTKELLGDRPLGDQTNMVFNGTTIVAGEGLAVVVATGIATEFGKIAQSVQDTKESLTPWQVRLKTFSRWLTIIVVIVAALLFTSGMLTGRPFTEMFTISVAVAVSAIPEGLAIGATVILVVGMRRILLKKALTRQLVAVETLGSTTVLCVDKTGTLTEGNMVVDRIVTDQADYEANSEALIKQVNSKTNSSLNTILIIGLLCNDAHVENEDKSQEHQVIVGDPTEKALIKSAHRFGLSKLALEEQEPRIAAIPFDSTRKYMATLNKTAEGNRAYFKGAPEMIFEFAQSIDLDGQVKPLSEERKKELLNQIEQMSQQSLRVLAFGYSDMGQNSELDPENIPPVVFVGFVGIKDPLRKESKSAITNLTKAGLTVVMITGDHRLTAQAIAKELSMPVAKENIITGPELESISDQELADRVRQIFVYARVTAADKIRIVKAWQASDEVVAMTGDGINDAAALKAADIGIALGSGTDVAKEASKIVLLDDNVKTIESAVEQGRIIFANVKKVTLYLLSDSFDEVVLISATVLFGFPLPLTAAQILWNNLITDGLPTIALTVEPKETDVMSEKPRPKTEALLDKDGRIFVGFISAVVGLLSLALFAFVYQDSQDLTLARSVAYAALGITNLTYVFSLSHLKQNLFKIDYLQNKWLLVAVFSGLVLLVMALYLPWLQKFLGTTAPSWTHWLLIILVNVVVIVTVEVIKKVLSNRSKKLAVT